MAAPDREDAQGAVAGRDAGGRELSTPGPCTQVGTGQPDSDIGSSQPEQSGQGFAASEVGSKPAPGEPGSPGAPEPEPSPVNNSDLAIALRRLPGFTRLLTQASAPPHGGSRESRRDGEPNAGAYQALDSDSNGIEITISGPGFRRHGRLAWPQVASWIDAGVTPARLGIIIGADRLSAFCRSRREELAAAGRCDPDAAASELDQIRDDTIRMVIDAALRTRGAAAPVPAAHPGKPAYYTVAMITRPDPAASREENATLERLTQLRAAIREQQPITAEEVKAEIRRWIGDGLPGYVRALGKPVAMRAWISRQASGPAGRPVRITYDTPGILGGRWHGASPEGLLTAVGNDDRAETLIPWEEIPAWVQPGITSSLRNRLTAADDAHTALARRRLTAAVHPQANLTASSDQDDEQATRLLREAIADAWAAVEAAPPPAPAQLEAALRTYRDTSPVQQALFDDPRQASHQGPGEQARPATPPQPAETRPPAPAAAPSGAQAPGIAPAEPGREQDAPAHAPARAVTHQGQKPGPAAGEAPVLAQLARKPATGSRPGRHVSRHPRQSQQARPAPQLKTLRPPPLHPAPRRAPGRRRTTFHTPPRRTPCHPPQQTRHAEWQRHPVHWTRYPPPQFHPLMSASLSVRRPPKAAPVMPGRRPSPVTGLTSWASWTACSTPSSSAAAEPADRTAERAMTSPTSAPRSPSCATP